MLKKAAVHRPIFSTQNGTLSATAMGKNEPVILLS
jgi:hypothetical protein